MNDKALANKEQQALEEWNSLQYRGQGNRTNTIKLANSPLGNDGKENPDYGKLFAIHYDEYGNEIKEEINIDTAEFLLVRVRVQIRCTDYDEKTEKAKYWCREVNECDLITVNNSDGEEVATGEYRELKDKYKLKFTHSVYVYYNERIYRWNIGGAHLGSWFEVKGAIDKTLRPHLFTVSHLTDEKTGTNHYKQMHFKMGDEYPIEKAIPIARQLDEGLAKYYESVQTKEKELLETSEEPVKDVEKDDLPF